MFVVGCYRTRGGIERKLVGMQEKCWSYGDGGSADNMHGLEFAGYPCPIA